MMVSEKVIKEMTLEEKARLVNGATFFGMAGLKRFGILGLQLLDGGTGMNFEQLFGDYYSRLEEDTNSTNGMMGSTVLANVIENYYHPEKLTDEEKKVYEWLKERLEQKTGSDYAPGCFPPGILLGATFNKEVVYAVGQALGAEAQLFGVHILLGSPNVNIHRDPLNGRLFEGYSEDPCLVSTLAPELVKGVQEYGVAANVKHFAANNQETNRVGINEIISERALKEIYLPGFRACVKEGHVKTVMSAYNRINGVPCTENDWLLTEELRDNWGFDGAVVSDWGAVYHPVEALKAGNDLAMPGPIDGTPIVKAVENGELKEEVLNQAVERLLEIIKYCTEDVLEGEEYVRIGEDKVNLISNAGGKWAFEQKQMLDATTKAAYDAAVEGIVLLKNENRMFPLEGKDVSRLVVLGSASEQLLECGTGSAGITTSRTSSLTGELEQVFGTECILVPENHGYDCGLAENLGLELIQKEDGLEAVPHIICAVKVSGMEGNDRTNLRLEPEDERLLLRLGEWKKKYSFKLALVLNVCGPVDLTPYEEFTDAIFVCFLPGMEGGHALADLMTGKRTPSGKLPLTFPKRQEDTPTFLNFPGEGYQVNYGEGIYVGYRYYDKKKIEPAYPFGFGLSYTSFQVKDVMIEPDKAQAGTETEKEIAFEDTLHISAAITNTGSVAGAEVLQVYISDPYSTLPKPVKELKAFEKIYLRPGESKKVTFTLKKEQFASYDPDYHCWIAEEGFYDVILAVSSGPDGILQKMRVYLINQTPYSYGMESTIKVLYEHKDLKENLKVLWNTKKWDWQIIESNYQYTPNRKLIEVLPEPCGEKDSAVAAFIQGVQKVKKI